MSSYNLYVIVPGKKESEQHTSVRSFDLHDTGALIIRYHSGSEEIFVYSKGTWLTFHSEKIA